ncbi:MAG TPA: glucose-1-phosphate cytidylyltransferase [Verrucomicrobiae bacterium]|nr:glucose-1-phosphate cytidylyltransferase [Verrucomicrobiae bacterium]
MKVVILCGGKGTRLREETEYRPKPMVPIGNRPILWHIMKMYAHYGHRDFILCLGYKGDIIRDYFRNYLWHTCDVTLALGDNLSVEFHNSHEEHDWRVTLADTGEETMTGGRIKRIERYLGSDEDFLMTYGDGVGDVDISSAIRFHRTHGKILTVTAVHPPGRFGEMGLESNGRVTEFNEKPQAEGGWINGGFFVASRRVFSYLENCDEIMFEQDPLRRLAVDGELVAYRHKGFWQPMDTFAEFNFLNGLWAKGAAPWQVWSKPSNRES